MLTLYGYETAIKSGGHDQETQAELGRKFMAGMSERISGIERRGAFGPKFSFSLTPRKPGDTLVAEFSSVARYVADEVNGTPVVLQWSSVGRGSGAMSLEATSDVQQFEFPFTLEMGEIATIDIDAVGEGFTPVGRREILGYFDRAGSKA